LKYHDCVESTSQRDHHYDDLNFLPPPAAVASSCDADRRGWAARQAEAHGRGRFQSARPHHRAVRQQHGERQQPRSRNLPVVVAGGGHRHGRHIAGDAANNTPLAKLFVNMLQKFGVETDRFGSGTGTITELS